MVMLWYPISAPNFPNPPAAIALPSPAPTRFPSKKGGSTDGSQHTF